jgi:hypothetical protein
LPQKASAKLSLIPDITFIIALARRETVVPPNAGAETSKLKSVVCDDFSNYLENVKKELAGADACSGR